MAPQKTLKAFLATARAALTAPPSKRSTPLHFVVGNESADLDSLCSALFLAYFRSHEPPHYTLHIPLCHLPRDDLALRPEFRAVLEHAAVTPDDVLTLTELPDADANSLRPKDTRWLLVDHNVMTSALGQTYSDSIVGCVDHHDDEGKVPHDATPRVIEKSGSCMSLVVEQCAETWEALAKEANGDEDSRRVNRQLAYLALGPILVDTNNLGNKDKTTTHDEHGVKVAEEYISAPAAGSGGGGGDGYDRAGFFDMVSALKEDISDMSLRDVFRKDYKEWTTEEEDSGLRLGTSSAPQSFGFLVDKAGSEEAFVKELERWSVEKKLDVTVVLTTHKDENGKFSRELLVWARSGAEVVGAVRKFVDGDGKDKLGLSTWGDGCLDFDAEGGDGWRRCWNQAKLENSRKQIAPMLRDALKGVV